jgi:hypothetical protein
VLTGRFGPLPDRITARVRAGTPQELDDWTDRFLTTPTLEDAGTVGEAGDLVGDALVHGRRRTAARWSGHCATAPRLCSPTL